METEEIIKQQISTAPPEIREYLKSGKWSLAIEDIAKKNNLTEDQKNVLENEVLFILLGMELRADLEKNLSQSAEIKDVDLKSICQDAEQNIFNNVAPFLPTEVEPQEILPNSTSEKVLPAVGASPQNLPVVEKNETAHDTTPEEKAFMNTPAPVTPVKESPVAPTEPQATQPEAQAPVKPSYPGGVDPYREPLE